jgi:alkylhydroperoxidase family enzyme
MGHRAYSVAMSRIGDFADDDAVAWVTRSPDIGTAMAGYTHAVYNQNRLPMRVRELARMVIALNNECVVCQNTRDSEGIAAGVDEDLYDNAGVWRTWPGYSDAERVAAEFAERFASDHTGLRDDEDFWDRAHQHFSDELITDLALSCAMWLGMGRMLRTLDIGQSCKITL